MNISYSSIWVTVERAAVQTGYSEDSIRHKIQCGLWVEGVEWKWADDHRQMVNLQAVDRWVERSTSRGSRRGRRQSGRSRPRHLEAAGDPGGGALVEHGAAAWAGRSARLPAPKVQAEQ